MINKTHAGNFVLGMQINSVFILNQFPQIHYWR